jgi:hypothetical protein
MNRRHLVTSGLAAALSLPLVTVGAQESTPASTPVADTANELLAGTGLDAIPQGNLDTVEVVAQSTILETSVAVVIRNTTSETVEIEEVIGAVRDSAGTLLTKVGFSEVGPKVLQPNGIAIGRVYLGDVALPMDADVQLAVKLQERPRGYTTLPIVELEVQGDGFVGAVKNPTNASVDFIEVTGVTLDQVGIPIGHVTMYAEVEDLDLLGVAYFEGSVRGQMSDLYLIAASAR